jgi:hypothetical protein
VCGTFALRSSALARQNSCTEKSVHVQSCSKAPRAASHRRRGSAAYQKESDLLLPCREARMNVCKRGVEPAVECSDHIAELRLLERL